MDAKTQAHVKESPWVVWLPLVLLAIPSVILGWLLVGPMLFDKPTLLGDSVFVLPQHDVLATLSHHYHGAAAFMEESLTSVTFWLVMAGVVTAWIGYIAFPSLPERLATRFSWIYKVLVYKYGFDDFNDSVIVPGSRQLGKAFFDVGDRKIIDGFIVNGSGYSVRWLALRARLSQSGYLYHYATAMVLGLSVFLLWLMLG